MIKLSEVDDYLHYGRCLASRDYHGALKALQRCLAIPEIKENFVIRAGLTRFMGEVYFYLGEKERAIECFSVSEQVDHSSLMPPYHHAKFLAEKCKDFSAAIDKCDAVIARATEHPSPKTAEDFSSEWYAQKARELKASCIQQLTHSRLAK